MSTVALYIGNLPYSVSRQQILEMVSEFDPISLSFAPGRNFAYVELNEHQVEPALESLSDCSIGDHQLLVKLADYTEPRLGTN